MSFNSVYHYRSFLLRARTMTRHLNPRVPEVNTKPNDFDNSGQESTEEVTIIEISKPERDQQKRGKEIKHNTLPHNVTISSSALLQPAVSYYLPKNQA